MKRIRRVPLGLGLALALALAIVPALTGPAAAQQALERARDRHQHADTTLHDYQARLNTLVSAGLIDDPLAPPRLILASELAAAITWDRESGQQIRMLGQRYVTSLGENVEAGLDFGRPWFVATTPGDSLRLLGSDIELPSRAAIHPFAEGAAAYYRYEIGDTIRLDLGARTVHLVEIRVTPTRGDAALVVGSVWVDGSAGDVTGMQVRFVGKPLWSSEENPEGSTFANRILSVSARLEQGLWEGRYWLPRRQEVELRVRVPFFANLAIPVVFRTEFGRYRINAGEPIAWLTPDSVRAAHDTTRFGARMWVRSGGAGTDSLRVITGPTDGGYEIIRPPDDSLAAYDEWQGAIVEGPTATLTLPTADELERRARALAPQIIGRRAFVFEYDRLADFLHYNRVEALGIGLSARWEPPGFPFWSLGGGLGFGVADLEPKGRLGVRYEPPDLRLDLAGYSELHTAGSSPLDPGTATTSPLRPLFTGRDDADYYRASGAQASLGRRWGRFRARIAAAVEDHESVRRHTGVALPDLWHDSVFGPNPSVDERTWWRGDLSTTVFFGEWRRPGGRGTLALGAELGTAGDGAEYVQPRLRGDLSLPVGPFPAISVLARAGWTGGTAPPQREWRVGGLRTVRGYPHGARRGDSFQALRLELTLRRGLVEPVIFAEQAWAGPTTDWPGDWADQIRSAGVGLGLLWGLARLDLVLPESGGPWLEFYLGGGR